VATLKTCNASFRHYHQTAAGTLLYTLQINPASNLVSFEMCIMLKISVIYAIMSVKVQQDATVYSLFCL